MSKYLGSTPFRDLLVHSIAADPTMLAAADALDAAFNKSVRAIPDVLLFARLANDSGFVTPVPMLSAMTRLSDLSGGLAELPSDVLDMLAWQLHVEGYEAAVDVQAKRRLIQGSLLLHRRKGTPWAVTNALVTALRLPTDLSEWFSYGGRPYFFRVGLDVTGAAFDATSAANAFRLIYEYKNVRSWLEYLATRSTQTLQERVGVGLCSRTKARCRLWFPVQQPPRLERRTGMALSGMTAGRSRLWFPVQQPPRQERRIGMAVQGVTSGKSRLWFPVPQPMRAARRTSLSISGCTCSRLALHFPSTRQPMMRRSTALGLAAITVTRLSPQE